MLLRDVSCQTYEDGAEHGEHHGLDEADENLKCGHEDTHDDTHGTHSKEHADRFGGYEEDDAHERDGNGVPRHDVGKETNHQGEGLGEDAHELYCRNEREGL